jgi:hypothetical protein
MDMPGFTRSEVSTEIDDMTLKIHAKKTCGGRGGSRGHQELGMWQKVQSDQGLCMDRERRLEMILPQEADVDHAKASLVNGILSLKFPRLHGSFAKHKQVSIYDEFETEHVYYARAKESAGGLWHRLRDSSSRYLFYPVTRFLGLQRPLESVRQKASQFGQRATEQASRVGQRVTDQAKDIPKSASGYFEKAQEQVGQGMQYASELAGEARESVEQVPHYVAEQVGKVVHGAQEQIQKGKEYMGNARVREKGEEYLGDQGYQAGQGDQGGQGDKGDQGERHKTVTLISML